VKKFWKQTFARAVARAAAGDKDLV
jgi:hypothetical protein